MAHNNTRIISSYLYLTIFLLLVSCSNGNFSDDKGLTPLFSFGYEGDGGLSNPLHIAMDNSRTVFISDQMASSVFTYDLDGNFTGRVGAPGRGPGEFIHQSVLATDGEKLYVQDQSNMRLIAFSPNGDHTATIKQDKAFLEFEVVRDTLYGFAPESMLAPISEIEEGLISVYAPNGSKVHSFGEYLDITDKMPAGMNWPHIEIANGTIHLAFTYFPLYRTYAMDGNLLFEADLSEYVGPEELKAHYDPPNYSKHQPVPAEMTAVIRALDVHGNRIFLCRQGRTLQIDEYLWESDGITHTQTYAYTDLPDDYYVKDFFYYPERNAFYVLEKNRYPRVTVYRLPGRVTNQ